MNKGTSLFLAGMLTVVLGLAVGCDWSSSSDDSSFNTSQGGGSTVNVSGFYEGALAGGQAVSSGTSIRNFTVVQSGNVVDIYDSNGSHYSGNIGAPGAVAEANDNKVYPSGAELVQYQISFSGFDVVSQRDVEFVGVIHLVAVNDVQGETSTYTVQTDTGKGTTNSTSRGSGTTNTVTESSGSTNLFTDADSVTKTVTTTVSQKPYVVGGGGEEGSGGDEVLPGQKVTKSITTYTVGNTTYEITETIVEDSVTGELVYNQITTNVEDSVSSTDSATDSRTSSDGEGEEEVSSSSSSKSTESYDSSGFSTGEKVTEEVTYKITEATSQLRLEGTWMFKDGNTAQVDALGPGAGGTIVESSETTTETTE